MLPVRCLRRRARCRRRCVLTLTVSPTLVGYVAAQITPPGRPRTNSRLPCHRAGGFRFGADASDVESNLQKKIIDKISTAKFRNQRI